MLHDHGGVGGGGLGSAALREGGGGEGSGLSSFQGCISNFFFLGFSCFPRLGSELLAGCPGGLGAHVPGAVLHGREGGGGGGLGSAALGGSGKEGISSSRFQWLLSNLFFLGLSCFARLGGLVIHQTGSSL